MENHTDKEKIFTHKKMLLNAFKLKRTHTHTLSHMCSINRFRVRYGKNNYFVFKQCFAMTKVSIRSFARQQYERQWKCERGWMKKKTRKHVDCKMQQS